MKVTIKIDCTPEEARAFLGMPDIRPLQDEVMAGLKERMDEALSRFDPEAMLKEWTGASGDGMNQMMEMWRHMLNPAKRD